MSVATAITQAAVDVLNAADLSLDFDAERKHKVEDKTLEDLKVVRVEAYPGGWLSELSDRGGATFDRYQVVLGVQKKMADVTDKTEFDALMDFVEEVHDLFRAQTGDGLTGYTDASWASTEVTVHYSEEDLREKGVFSAVLTMTFEIGREVD